MRKVGLRRQSECFSTCTWCDTLATYLCYSFGTRGRPVELCQQALAHHLCPELHACSRSNTRVRGRPHASRSLKEVFVDDTHTVHVLGSRTACLGTTLSILSRPFKNSTAQRRQPASQWKRHVELGAVISDDPHSIQRQLFFIPCSCQYDVSDILCFTFDGSMFT